MENSSKLEMMTSIETFVREKVRNKTKFSLGFIAFNECPLLDACRCGLMLKKK